MSALRPVHAAWALVLPALLLLGLTCLCGCRGEGHDGDATGSQGTENASGPPPSFRDDTPGLLLVWVQPNGDFQTGTKPGDVPTGSREVVRVVLEKAPLPAANEIWVANLDRKAADGSYKTRGLARQEWEQRGMSQRKARVEAESPAPAASGAPSDVSGIQAIVYGASWCKPCHMAEDYLRQRGAQVTKKDIEEDPAAQAEMRQKLKAAGLGGASIPVLDVGGTVLVGFSSSAVDAALRRAGGAR